MPKKMLTGVDLNNQRGVNFADPSAATDAANKQYVDNVARGLKWKQSARAATTGNISLTAPGTTIDGVALNANDRVLVKNQTTGSENGIYVWTASGSALTRANDADTAAKIQSAVIGVDEGTVNKDTVWNQITDGITLGTSSIVWSPLGAGISYSAGTGLVLAGSVFSIDTAVVTRKISGTIGDGTATTITASHNLGTKDVDITLRLIATDEVVEADIFNNNINSSSIVFATAPAAGSVRWTAMG